ncbi:MAG: hypothetical protein GY935_12135 [Gammaproteobacteria bacterium]|nr:hypothetical protein [Gammaproteobacteria bacterium]
MVIENGAWGAGKACQNEFFGGRLLGSEISSPNYVELVRFRGADGYSINKPGETTATLEAALAAAKASVTHVKVGPEAVSALRKDLFKKK